mmetsp:Transcript_31925/g.52677  ORF Transcript_31925/g.52677 Transcript_31925/m.52677 type:complete len:264 (-) Transcript_31925:51-842(-)
MQNSNTMQLPIFIPAIAPRLIKERDTPLEQDFQPGQYDVICQRGKQAYRHVGNRRFRLIIESHVEQYAMSETKVDKSLLVIHIVDMVRQMSPDGGFVRFCKKKNYYVEIGDHLAREKVGHALREIMNGKKKTTKSGGYGNQKALEVIRSSSVPPTSKPFDDFATLLSSSTPTTPLTQRTCHEPLPLGVASFHHESMPLLDAFARDLARHNLLREPSSLEQMRLASLVNMNDGEGYVGGVRPASPSEQREILHQDLKTFNLFQI